MVKALKQTRYVGLMVDRDCREMMRELKDSPRSRKQKFPLSVTTREAIQEYYERNMEESK